MVQSSQSQSAVQTHNSSSTLVVTRRSVTPGIRAEVLIPLNYSEPTRELYDRLGEEVFFAEQHAEPRQGTRNIYYSELTGGPQGGIAVIVRIDLIEYNMDESHAFVRDFTKKLLIRLVEFDLASDLTIATATIGSEVFEYQLETRKMLDFVKAKNKAKILVFGVEQPSDRLLEQLEAGLKVADDAVAGYGLVTPCHRIKLQQEGGELQITLKFCFTPEESTNGQSFGMTERDRVKYLVNAADEVRLACDPGQEKGLMAFIIDGQKSYRCPAYY